MIDMPEDKCTDVIVAAMDVIQEECEGTKGNIVNVGDGVLAYFPESEKERLGHSPGNPPENETELEELISRCVGGDWARSWSRKVVGPGAPEDVLEATAERVCRGLYT